MKGKLFLIILLSSIFLSINAYSMNFMAGAKSGYYYWKPSFSDLKGGGLEQVDRGDGLLYGPVVSAMFTDDISLTVSLLTGKQLKYWSENNVYKDWGPGLDYYTGTYNIEISRTDVDTALSYNLGQGWKIIAGYKYQQLKMNVDTTYIAINSNSAEYLSETLELPAHGPAIGAGYSHAFSDTYFAAANLTVAYLWSKWEFTKFEYTRFQPDGSGNLAMTFSSQDVGSFKAVQYGFNLEPSAGARIKDDFLVTIGFRFQWMKTKTVGKFDPGGTDLTPDKPLNDYIYGIFVSAIYLF